MGSELMRGVKVKIYFKDLTCSRRFLHYDIVFQRMDGPELGLIL